MDGINKEKVKEIVAKGRKNGRILHVSEAFVNYPVEDEAHKGELEYFQNENKDSAKL